MTSNVSRFILKYETERCSTSEEFASSSSGEIRIDRADPPSNTRSFKLFSSAREIRIYDTRMSREFLTELLRPRRAESIPLPDRERERERRSGCPCRNQSHLTRWVRRNFIYQILGARPTRLIRATLRIELCNTEGNRVLPALSISPRKPVRQPVYPTEYDARTCTIPFDPFSPSKIRSPLLDRNGLGELPCIFRI